MFFVFGRCMKCRIIGSFSSHQCFIALGSGVCVRACIHVCVHACVCVWQQGKHLHKVLEAGADVWGAELLAPLGVISIGDPTQQIPCCPGKWHVCVTTRSTLPQTTRKLKTISDCCLVSGCTQWVGGTAALASSPWSASTPTPTSGRTARPWSSDGEGWVWLPATAFSTLSADMRLLLPTPPVVAMTVLSGMYGCSACPVCCKLPTVKVGFASEVEHCVAISSSVFVFVPACDMVFCILRQNLSSNPAALWEKMGREKFME